MTFLALPNPGPPWAAAVVSPAPAEERNMSASVRPKTADPPTRMKSRRVGPSQVSLPANPGMTSMGPDPLRGKVGVCGGNAWAGVGVCAKDTSAGELVQQVSDVGQGFGTTQNRSPRS